MKNKVSIIIPTYNGEKYIKETIDSCLSQTYKNIEIIVIDDNSSDRTVDILNIYDDRINLILNKINLGIVKNVNNGVNISNGEYYIFLGHDDNLPSNHIEIMLNEFNEDTIAVYCSNMGIDGDGNQTKINQPDEIMIAKTNNIMFEFSIDNFISSCGMMHRTDVFHKIGGWDERYLHYGEWLYYIKELEYGKIKYTSKTKAFYRTHETNITKTFKDKNVKIILNRYKSECRKMAHLFNDNSLTENINYFINKFKVFIKLKELKIFIKKAIKYEK